MQCIKEKTDILFLPILPYNKSKISKTINIFRESIQYLDFNNYAFEDKIVIVKRN